ncbi:MAG: pyruvate ferredoxin oxidoreductase [Hyphomicrobiales bacterium]|nr:MAG: pyruvate ferredoxin oxidoreductase [Hyphomicrobiales bacterium]
MNDKSKIEKPVNVLIVGVGGQGVIMVSKVLALLCQTHGFEVKQSEVHGMAKRGGGVFSHIRFGPKVWSPTIPKGKADILLALEWAEAMRWLDHLKPGGTFIADTQRIVPPFACRNRKRGAERNYSRETPAEIIDKVKNGYALDAEGMAMTLGNRRVANTILLGVLSTALDFSPESWQAVIEKFVPPHTIETNAQAFQEGRSWTANAVKPLPVVSEAPSAESIDITTELTINTVWCKGCDICVKMCPERCLALNEDQEAVLIHPDKCTGCRICEWLCPDYAIKLHKRPNSQTEGTGAGV